MEPPRAPRKIRKQEKFTSKKALIKRLLDVDSDLEQYALQYEVPDLEEKRLEDHFPMKFSHFYKSNKVDLLDQDKTASINSLGREGSIVLDFPLNEKTSWQLQMCLISHSASFGICAIKNDHPEGPPPLSQSYMIRKGEKVGQFQFQNNQLVQMTFDPKKRTLGFFNTKTIKSCTLDVPPLQEGYQYWPVVDMVKSTVYLKQDYLLKKAKEEALAVKKS